MSPKANLVLGLATGVFVTGYVLERKRRCIHHTKAACVIGETMAGESTAGCEQEAKKKCRLFGVF